MKDSSRSSSVKAKVGESGKTLVTKEKKLSRQASFQTTARKQNKSSPNMEELKMTNQESLKDKIANAKVA